MYFDLLIFFSIHNFSNNSSNSILIVIEIGFFLSKIFGLDLDKNLAKQEACLEQGYNFIFIKNKNYEEFDRIISKSS